PTSAICLAATCGFCVSSKNSSRRTVAGAGDSVEQLSPMVLHPARADVRNKWGPLFDSLERQRADNRVRPASTDRAALLAPQALPPPFRPASDHARLLEMAFSLRRLADAAGGPRKPPGAVGTQS